MQGIAMASTKLTPPTPESLQQIYRALYDGVASTIDEIAAHTGHAPPLVEATIEKLIELRLVEVENAEELRYTTVV
jgi:Mn-dependent DtxR family transcriptional regulator